MVDDLGRLRKTTNQKCPLCKRPLQIRVRQYVEINEEGEEITRDHDYIRCSSPSCDYELETKKNVKRGKKEWR